MGATLRPSEFLPALDAHVDAAGQSLEDTAERMGLTPDAVRVTLKRWEPVLGALTSLRKDFWIGAWQWIGMKSFERMQEPGIKAKDFRDFAVSMGVATDKTMILCGMPTQIVVGVHEHRLQLPALLDKMRDVSARLSASG